MASGWIVAVTRYHHDELGQLASISLPDGGMLNYKRNVQNQVAALDRSLIKTRWLAWLLPAKDIVKIIARDIIGLKSFVYGNGVESEFQRSREGVLARLVAETC